jgi:MFS family permease
VRSPTILPEAFTRAFGRLLIVISAVVFVDTTFFTAITPLLPHYVHVLRLSKSEAGILVAAYPIGTFLGAVPGGVFASRFGVRRAVVTGLALMSAATLVFGFVDSVALLDSARVVQGIGGACTWAGALSWLTQAAPSHRRAEALGVAFAAAIGGALLGPALGALASSVGTRTTFAAATGAAVCLIVASTLVYTPERNTETGSIRGALVSLRDPSLAGGMWLTGLAGLALGVIDTLSPLRLSHLGASAVVIGGAFLGAAAVEAALAPIIGRLADRRGRATPVRLSLAGALVVSLLAPFLYPEALLVALLIVGLPAYGTLYVPAAAMIGDGAARRGLDPSMGFGIGNLVWAGGQAVAAAGSGALAQATVDAVPYVILAGMCGGTLVLIGVKRRRRLAPI